MYRNYKHFSNKAFMFDVKNSIIQRTSENNNLQLDRFKSAFEETMQRPAPMKKQYARAKPGSFTNKKIKKEIIKRSRLRNKFLNTKSDINRKTYNKQCNLCVSLIKSEKKNFIGNINTSYITDNKNFRKTVELFFTDKIKTKHKIMLIRLQQKFLKNSPSILFQTLKYLLNMVMLMISWRHMNKLQTLQIGFGIIQVHSDKSNQIQLFFDSLLLKYQHGFSRGCNAYHYFDNSNLEIEKNC